MLVAVVGALLTAPRTGAQQTPRLPRDRAEQLFDPAFAREPLPPEVIAPDKAVRFSLRGSDLVVSSDLKVPSGELTEIKLLGLNGTTRVEMGRRFALTWTKIDEEGNGSEQVNVDAGGGRIRLTRMMHAGDLWTTVSFLQDSSGLWRRGRSLEQRGDSVSLRIRSNVRTNGPVFPSTTDLRAASFEELLRKYPGMCAKHLVPLFREFNQDLAVFRVEGHLAWQLFPEAFNADAAMTSKVMSLVERLDAGDFRERELATTELDVLGGGAVVVLGDIDRTPLTPEQRTRIDAVLARFNQLSGEQIADLLDDAEFLLRCFIYGETEPIRAAAVRAISQKFGADKAAVLKPGAKLADRFAAAEDVRGHIPTQPMPQE
jgi:hypothetical protein